MPWKSSYLEKCEEVDLRQWNVPQVGVVWLVLGGHEDDCAPLNHLHALEGRHPHVHKDPVEHRHWYELWYENSKHASQSRMSSLSTQIRATLRIGASFTERPVKTKTMVPVTRCSLTPRNWGVSPGALHSVSILRESTWPRQRTVAATHQGRPRIEQRPIVMPTMSMSRW